MHKRVLGHRRRWLKRPYTFERYVPEQLALSAPIIELGDEQDPDRDPGASKVTTK